MTSVKEVGNPIDEPCQAMSRRRPPEVARSHYYPRLGQNFPSMVYYPARSCLIVLKWAYSSIYVSIRRDGSSTEITEIQVKWKPVFVFYFKLFSFYFYLSSVLSVSLYTETGLLVIDMGILYICIFISWDMWCNIYSRIAVISVTYKLYLREKAGLWAPSTSHISVTDRIPLLIANPWFVHEISFSIGIYRTRDKYIYIYEEWGIELRKEGREARRGYAASRSVANYFT